MTMRNLMWAALATSLLLAGTEVGSAQDTVRLGGPSAQAAIQGGTDTDLVAYRHSYGGHRAYYGGNYGRSYYGGNYGRSYYGGYYARPYYSSYYAQPYYYPRASYYYAPTYYYPSYYSTPYYSYSSSYYYPISGEGVPPPATTLQGTGYSQAPAQRPYVTPIPPANGDGTFQYDGGPRSPIPMPNPETNPANRPNGILPIDGKLVSLPTATTGGTSQYRTSAQQPSTPRVSYPAYGEEPITPAPRKTTR
jgi:hypothetical protein